MEIKGFDYGYFKQALFDYIAAEYSDWAKEMTADDLVKIVREVVYPDVASDEAALETLNSDYGASWGLSPNQYFNSTLLGSKFI